jgi:hypothetical protein
MAIGGAKMTYGTKKIDNSRLYWPGAKLRSNLLAAELEDLIWPLTLAHPISLRITKISLIERIEEVYWLLISQECPPRDGCATLTHYGQDGHQPQIKSATERPFSLTVDNMSNILHDSRGVAVGLVGIFIGERVLSSRRFHRCERRGCLGIHDWRAGRPTVSLECSNHDALLSINEKNRRGK